MNQPPSPVYAGVDIAKATLQLHFQTRQHLLARAFTTELARVGSPLPVSVMTGWLIVIYHRRTFTGWTGSLMGCEQRTSPRVAEAKLSQRDSVPTLASSATSALDRISCLFGCGSVALCLCVETLLNSYGSVLACFCPAPR